MQNAFTSSQHHWECQPTTVFKSHLNVISSTSPNLIVLSQVWVRSGYDPSQGKTTVCGFITCFKVICSPKSMGGIGHQQSDRGHHLWQWETVEGKGITGLKQLQNPAGQPVLGFKAWAFPLLELPPPEPSILSHEGWHLFTVAYFHQSVCCPYNFRSRTAFRFCPLSVPQSPSWQWFCWCKMFSLGGLLCMSWEFTLLHKRFLHGSFLDNPISLPGFCWNGWGDPWVTHLISSKSHLSF